MSADYSQIELRILAHVSGEPKLREAFARGEDIHRATAAEVLGVEPGRAHDRPALDREDDQLRDRLRHLGVRALGEPRDPARAGAGATSTPTSRASRTCRTSSRGRSSRRRATATSTSLLGRRRPVPEIRASNRADALARRAARGQLRHAGLERGHHQGGDDPHPRPPARRGPRRAARAAGARRAAARGARRRGRRPSASSCARRCAAPTTSTRRSRSTSASARTGPRRRAEAREPRRA